MKENKLSTKDLSYICDMFNWNINCYNAFKHFKKLLTDEEAVTLCDDIAKMHKNACKKMLKLMN